MRRRTIRAFQDAIRKLHGAESTYVESVPVREDFEGHTVWSGIVQVFDLQGHPTATRAYAWSHATVEEPAKTRYVAVLHQGPVDSPRAAVQAAIVQEVRELREEEDG